MTAVLGILNKHAIAIAADSAVTISGPNGKKIFNKANKVFSLSKYHPVGILIYNSATFLSTPWEPIIKIYRDRLGNQAFDTLSDYQKDFITFLRKQDFYTDKETKDSYLYFFFNKIFELFIYQINEQNPALFLNPSDTNRAEVLEMLEKNIDVYIARKEGGPFCPDFENLTFDDFINNAEIIINTSIIDYLSKNGFEVSQNLNEKIRKLFFTFIRIQENITPFTGLVFVGYGEGEIYPSLISLNISLVFGDRLRFYIDENEGAIINNTNDSAIRPFAQTDVIDTILSGVDPSLETWYIDNFEKFFKKFADEVINVVKDVSPDLNDQIRAINIDLLLKELRIQCERAKRANYIQPLMNAVSTLSKEDLAEMAESLVYLTYLKRRITNAEETVGGPVDIAVISKGDGFVWIKRKHYFKPELNQHFFATYFNKFAP